VLEVFFFWSADVPVGKSAGKCRRGRRRSSELIMLYGCFDTLLMPDQ